MRAAKPVSDATPQGWVQGAPIHTSPRALRCMSRRRRATPHAGVERVLNSARQAVDRGLSPAAHLAPSTPAHYAAAALALLAAPGGSVVAAALEARISKAAAAAMVDKNMAIQEAQPLGRVQPRTSAVPQLLERQYRPCSRAEVCVWAGMQGALEVAARPVTDANSGDA